MPGSIVNSTTEPSGHNGSRLPSTHSSPPSFLDPRSQSWFCIDDFDNGDPHDASTYIRLLEVVSVDPARDVSVRCELTTWLKESAPAYTAISYTWGDPRQVAAILVNGGRMTVRRNCEDVLRQQCWAKGGHFWIDAICINQADNDEKSVQVAGMGEVYRDARQTLACVGHHADDSEFLFETLHEHRRGYKEDDGYISDIYDIQGLREYLSRVLSDDSTLVRLEKALSTFFERPYFRRVWVYQELFLGTDIRFCCSSNQTVELSLLWALYLAIWIWELSPCDSGGQPLFYVDNDKILLRSVAAGKIPFEFPDIIPIAQELECEDPRDRLFGTLAMIDWEGDTPIRPDYSMDSFDLTVEILQRLENPRNFLGRVLTDTIRIACLVGLYNKPSRRLADEILTRRSREDMAPSVGVDIMGQAIEIEPTIFWGYRIHSHDAGWHMLSDASKGLDYEGPVLRQDGATDLTSHAHSFTIHKWSKETLWDVRETAILLPAEAEPQDWLLIPDLAAAGYTHPPTALIARDGGHVGQTHIVGKALFAASGDWPWQALRLEGCVFGVHLDDEDAIVLAHGCNWDSWGKPFSSDPNEQHKLQVDDYFETRLCGGTSKTWVERMTREPH